MRSFTAAVPIRASKEQVWAILTDAESYPYWNPAIVSVDGEIAPGEHLKVYPKDPYEKSYEVLVSECSGPNKMVWERRLGFNALIATRTFRLRMLKDGRVEFEIREVHTGWGASWFRKSLPDLQRTFEIFAVALQQAAEISAVDSADLSEAREVH